MVPRVLVDSGPLAETLFGDAEELPFTAADSHPDDNVALLQPDPDDPLRGAPFVAHVRLCETHRLSLARHQQHVVGAVGELAADHLVFLRDSDGDEPRAPDVGVLGQGGLFHDPVAGPYQDELVGLEVLDGEDVGDRLVLAHIDQVDDRLPLAGGPDVGDLVNLQQVNLAAIREDEKVTMRRRHEDVVDEILFARGHPNPALSSASLRPVQGGVGALDISRVRYCNDHILFGDQVLQCDLDFLINDFGPARIPIILLNFLQLIDDDPFEGFFAGKDLLEAGDQLQGFFVFAGNFLALQARQALQAHFQDGLRLGLTELKLRNEPLPGHGRATDLGE